jgi:uncharacterized membrane protein
MHMTSPQASSHRSLSYNQERRIAYALGWLSIGVGLAQIFAPRAVSRLIGAPRYSRIVRAMGVRELVTGIGMLTGRNPAPWLWSRVAGDVADGALLGAASLARGADRKRIGVTAAAVAAAAALDSHSAKRLTARVGATGLIHVRESVVIGQPADRLYEFWRNVENLPRVMRHLQSVSLTGGNRSHWVAAGPAGMTIEWDSEIIVNRPDEELAWQSIPGSGVYNAGSVQFEPVDRNSTQVTVHMAYRPPAGPVGVAIASLFGREPQQEIEADLRGFKQVMEGAPDAAPGGTSVPVSR